MCVHCQQTSCQKSTSFTEDSPAKTSALLELEKAWKEAEAAYSSRSCDSLMYYDHNSSSWKMCQQSLLEDLLPLPKKLPKEAMIRDGVLYPLVKLAHPIKEKDGGYLPTPTARDYKDNGKSPAELARNSKTLATHAGGQLNPQWVEWLMGYPVGWTELKDSVMQWYLNARKQRSKRSQQAKTLKMGCGVERDI